MHGKKYILTIQQQHLQSQVVIYGTIYDISKANGKWACTYIALF